MYLRGLIKKVINEELKIPTDFGPVYWKVPKHIRDDIGVRLAKEEDVLYLQEIHFDTSVVLLMPYAKDETGEEYSYSDLNPHWHLYPTEYRIPFKKIPPSLMNFIRRRLPSEYFEYMNFS